MNSLEPNTTDGYYKSRVSEVQGLYGPVTISERTIQKLWLRQDFDTSDLKTLSGKTLEVEQAGRWNTNEGPDFLEATMLIDGKRITCDVEIHLYSRGWREHGHHKDENFSKVRLHVVLFPDKNPLTPPETCHGETLDTLYLLPCLHEDLETIIERETLARDDPEDYAQWLEALKALPKRERIQTILERARRRWQSKCQFARTRLEKHEWDDACHQLCLEVLGYRRNRAAMARLALETPMSEFMGMESVESLYAQYEADWQLAGSRPANHPKKRLEQYLQLVKHNPKWPENIQDMFSHLPVGWVGLENTDGFRNRYHLSIFRSRLVEEVFGSAITSTRFDTLMIDAFLPLASAFPEWDFFPVWYHWYPGDAPDKVSNFIKDAELTGPREPASNGLNQGVLQIFYEGGFL